MVNKKDDKSILLGIQKYIQDLLYIVEENKITKNDYLNSILYRHAIHMCLFQVGELSKWVSDDFKLKHTEIPWAEMRGLRNVEAHDYDNLDLNAIWETIQRDIPVLMKKIEKIV